MDGQVIKWNGCFKNFKLNNLILRENMAQIASQILLKWLKIFGEQKCIQFLFAKRKKINKRIKE